MTAKSPKKVAAIPKKGVSKQTVHPKSTGTPCPIVGIGASVGGLGALEKFLGNVPQDSGLAFVVLQHLDPTHKTLMPELLQRVTPMRVVEVKDGTRVHADCVYVMPPNKDVSILRGVLHLLTPAEHRGFRLPIDHFFRALAEDQRERSIAVVLSGMGTDGTLGVRTVKEKGGLVLAQDPATADFDSMPRSAIASGLVDIVSTPDMMCKKIMGFLAQVPRSTPPETVLNAKTQNFLDKAIVLLRSQTGHDFSVYKKNTLYRRIERRMGVHQLSGMDQYIRFLQENPAERDLLFKELLIGVTNFFRDAPFWDNLRDVQLPALFARKPDGGQIRAWVPGCSTGEEAYSLAIVLREAFEKARPRGRFTFHIFATDLDRDAVDRARQGQYPANISADVSPERLHRHFVKEGDGYRVSREIREMVVLAPQNVLMDPPFTKLDILSCRNLMIYLSSEAQKQLLKVFHYSLNPDGILFLGSSETVGGLSSHFEALDSKCRLYRRKKSVDRMELVDFPSTFFNTAPARTKGNAVPSQAGNLQTLADQLLLARFSPANVLVNDKGDILYVGGRTGKYLEPAAGRANWNILAMAREGLRHVLASAFREALRKGTAVTVSDVSVEGGKEHVDVLVEPLETPEALSGTLLVIFTERTAAPEKKATGRAGKPGTRKGGDTGVEQELERLHRELQTNRAEMQNSQEELRSVVEELQSANEEFQSANEEFQSTNEELTTSKEELQSLNEELQTVNTELQSKLDELSRSNNDMRNLLDSTDIATVFLDAALNIRRFTAQTARIIKLIPGDVGRPITDISTDLIYAELSEDAESVLRTLVPVERQVSTRDGRWFGARIMPYRTLDNVIDGVVITFADITHSKELEAELRKNQRAPAKTRKK